jgi:hypothetical protein
VFTGTVLESLVPAVGTPFTLFSRGTGAAINDVSFIGTTYLGGASLGAEGAFMRTNTPYDFSLGWHLSVHVVDGAGNDLIGHPVRVEDSTGTTVVTATTDASGRCAELRLNQSLHSGPAWRDEMTVEDLSLHRLVVAGASPRSLIMDRHRAVQVVVSDTRRPRVIPHIELEPDAAGFRFRVPAAGRVELEVFDLRGRRIARVASGFRSAGWHRVPWSRVDDRGARIAAGVYLARMRTLAGDTERKILIR